MTKQWLERLIIAGVACAVIAGGLLFVGRTDAPDAKTRRQEPQLAAKDAPPSAAKARYFNLLPPEGATTSPTPGAPALLRSRAQEQNAASGTQTHNFSQSMGGSNSLQLRYPEIPLRNPVVWRVPPSGGSPPPGGTEEDLIVAPNLQNVPVVQPVSIKGYRNILIENIALKPLPPRQGARAVAALTIERTAPGVVWVASSTIDTARADMGAILLSAPAAAGPTRFVIASSTLTVRDSKRGVGVFAWQGALARFEARNSFVSSDNIGFRLAPQRPTDTLEEAFLRDITLQRTHDRLEQARLLEVRSSFGSALRAITLENVRIVPQKGVPLGELVYPGHTAKDPDGAPIALRQAKDPETGATLGVWIFTTPSGAAAVRGVIHYE